MEEKLSRMKPLSVAISEIKEAAEDLEGSLEG